MDAKRLTEWLGSIEGLARALIGLFGAVALVFVAVTDQFEAVVASFELPAWVPKAVAMLLLLPLLALVVRSYRRFATASRLEQPDRFTLIATTPESLIGRDEDLQRLQHSVARNRIVLLDGESGCGKSALISAGLVPQLKAGSGLLPVLIRDWGDDWVRGPVASALGALFETLTQEERKTLQWTQEPDLAAPGDALVAELDARLTDIHRTLARRPLLITDQFDDYQAQHREKFLDGDGNWLSPDALATNNLFWALVGARLSAGEMHLLAVTRADTASGLSCIRFLDNTMIADRQLPRVEVEHLRPLLAGIAPDDAEPPIVSYPDQGWHELRDRVEMDLRAQGAILMQQVRTVLLGLRQLSVLTVRAYRQAGDMRGLEMLVIARAVRHAGSRAGGGDAGQRLARAILGALVLPGDSNQPPKAQRCTDATLQTMVGDPRRAEAVLLALQAKEVVRPAEGASHEIAWQLDHDYLARAVLAEARQADRWGVALREGMARFAQAVGDWRQRWAALLPISMQTRLLWEWLRGRMAYGEGAAYARLSLLKPGLALALVVAAACASYAWNSDRLLTTEARAIYERFGGVNEKAAVLDAWWAPEPVRIRLYRLVTKDSGRLERATRSAWPMAHGGLEPLRLAEAAKLLRARLAQESNDLIASDLASAYAAVARKLDGQDDIKAEAAMLRASLEQERDDSIGGRLADAYAAVAQKLDGQDDIKAEAAMLRARLEHERDDSIAWHLADAYAAVAQKLDGQEDIKVAAAALRARLEHERDDSIAWHLVGAYAAVAQKLDGPDDIKSAAAVLRARLEREREDSERGEREDSIAGLLAETYAAVARKLDSQDDIKAAAAVLRTRLEQERDDSIAERLTNAYAAVTQKLDGQDDIKAEAATLRARLEHERDDSIAWHLAAAYAAVAQKLDGQDDIKAAAAVLRARLEHESKGYIMVPLAGAYAAVVQKLDGPDDIKVATTFLRARLEHERDERFVGSFAEAYTAVAQKLDRQDDIKAEAAALRARLEQDVSITVYLAEAYAAVAQKLDRQDDIKAVAAALRARLEGERDNLIATYLAAAYAAVAQKLDRQEDIKAAAEVLRGRLEGGVDLLTAPLAEAYALVAQKLDGPDDIKAAAAVLRARLEQEREDYIARPLADAYAAVVRRYLEELVRSTQVATIGAAVADILVMLGHPFLPDGTHLLAALEPVAKRSFGSDTAAAVAWWVVQFKGDPATLRPSPPRSG